MPPLVDQRTLVVLPNWVGDTVMTLPFLAALKKTERQIWALAKPHLLPFLRLVPGISGAIARQLSNREMVTRLRTEAFPEAVVLPNSFRSAWIPFRAGVPVRWGYGRQLRSPLLTQAVTSPDPSTRHQTIDYRELLLAMNGEEPKSWQPRLELTPETLENGRRLLANRQTADGVRKQIGLFPGAEFGASKRWPPDHFAELLQQLKPALPAARLTLFAGPNEVGLAQAIACRSGIELPIIGPDLDLADLTAALSQLDLLITNDSGPMHLAAAVGVPCIALFGPTNPRRTAPTGDHHTVLYSGRWCSPCFRRRCPLLHHRCMKEISVQQISEIVPEALDRRRQG